MSRTGRSREGVIEAGKNYCAGTETTNNHFLKVKFCHYKNVGRHLNVLQCEVCFFKSKYSLLTENDLLNLSIFFIVVENVLGFWQEIVEQWNKMQEIL